LLREPKVIAGQDWKHWLGLAARTTFAAICVGAFCAYLARANGQLDTFTSWSSPK
jgi:hypothetical protein